MKKMVKGCAIVTIVASMTMFVGCGKASKYESMLEEMADLTIEAMELTAEKGIEIEVKEFKKLSKEKQEEKLKEAEKQLKKAKEDVKELKKKLKEVKSEEDLIKLPSRF